VEGKGNGKREGKGEGEREEKGEGKRNGKGKVEDSSKKVGHMDGQTHGCTDTQVILYSVQCYALHWTDKSINSFNLDAQFA